ncbi:MAG: hypothetical protein IPN69_16770 [Acidobacteria bacterium]|nr:hypothetical protein [Acidobacteriota bacterium]MBK8812364.1 hypothetical protein [Acidobacteriota bacterium]
MRFNKLYTTTVLFVVALFVFASAVTAQQSRYSRRDVGNTIAKLERSSNTFRRDFDKYLDQSSINGTNEENRINRIVSNFETALDRLRSEFDRNDNWWASRNNVRSVMDEARAVNGMMNNLSFARKLENQWKNMRRDINELAGKYELPALNTNTTGSGNAPSWAVGTFFGRNPQNGDRIQITIIDNGSVTAEIGGAASYGTLNGTLLDMGTATARVSRLNNGIRTTNTATGETIDYYRNNDGGDWNNNDNKRGDIPSWAVGTFYGRNPQNGGSITLIIQSSGEVTVNMDGGVSYGSMYRTTFTVNNESANVTRISNGIRTTNNRTGERIDYSRRNDGNGDGNWNTGNPPRWAVGTWYGLNPQTNRTMTLRVEANGQVTITMDNGQVAYASMDGDRLNNNGIIARVTRINDGIRTTRLDTNERIDYFRTNNFGGGNQDNNQMGDVPSWAVGTFYGRNPQNGGNITLTVQSNGNVTVNMDGNISYGSMYKTTFTVNGETASVKKIANGFRMTNTRTGEQIEYRRQ